MAQVLSVRDSWSSVESTDESVSLGRQKLAQQLCQGGTSGSDFEPFSSNPFPAPKPPPAAGFFLEAVASVGSNLEDGDELGPLSPCSVSQRASEHDATAFPDDAGETERLLRTRLRSASQVQTL